MRGLSGETDGLRERHQHGQGRAAHDASHHPSHSELTTDRHGYSAGVPPTAGHTRRSTGGCWLKVHTVSVHLGDGQGGRPRAVSGGRRRSSQTVSRRHHARRPINQRLLPHNHSCASRTGLASSTKWPTTCPAPRSGMASAGSASRCRAKIRPNQAVIVINRRSAHVVANTCTESSYTPRCSISPMDLADCGVGER